jgi:cytochrome c-type biogenesis protein CcmE
MNMKIIIGGVVIAGAVLFGASSFIQTNVEYADFQIALLSNRKVQVKGEWQQGKETRFDGEKGEFSFFMKDEKGYEMKVIYDGAKPNNFEMANAIVIKGRAEGSCFHASEILTKCPSKYEADPSAVRKNL